MPNVVKFHDDVVSMEKAIIKNNENNIESANHYQACMHYKYNNE
ncbi:hypothetical protein KAN5_22140 [Pseudoalteromonas sp. KAN5]|nr:hypothetical protein KAN5_22140 [Pseudoalteromonas sp. KAN5]